MEMFELKYFLAVAQVENVNRAAENIHVSAGSLSKAVSRLETELGTPLFFKAGRGIRLTPEGRHLKKRAADIVALEEDVKLELQGPDVGSVNIYISSEEILQTSYGIQIAKKIDDLIPNARVQFLIRPESIAIQQVLDGEAHLAIVTHEPPKNVVSKIIAKVDFKTCASPLHPLLKSRAHNRKIPIDEVLKYPFVAPDTAILGKIAKSDSIDGWRDDKFPRKIKYKVCGLKLMENLIKDGLALAYLPEYFVESSGLKTLNVTGCPYSCSQSVKVLAKDPTALSWLNKLWDQI
ncbi:MAG: LysR family transcriptional regulator [Bdellovibrionaceae bacterium]|nr:LysR family transcriptional regulator [Pseudobdellovibrionaceae bacterium]